MFSRKYIALGRVVTCWEQIVGPEMAARAHPVKIRYRKRKGPDSCPCATLEVAATSADATVLQYQTGVLLEKIERIFGDRWITSIRFVHVAANLPRIDASPKKSLTDDQKSNLSLILEGTCDPDIHKRLESLGSLILLKNS